MDPVVDGDRFAVQGDGDLGVVSGPGEPIDQVTLSCLVVQLRGSDACGAVHPGLLGGVVVSLATWIRPHRLRTSYLVNGETVLDRNHRIADSISMDRADETPIIRYWGRHKYVRRGWKHTWTPLSAQRAQLTSRHRTTPRALPS